MIYAILKFLFRITFKVFFRKAYYDKADRVPENGPLIICANHPGAFLDPVVLATVIKRRVFFLAKGSVFKGAFAKWLFPRLNMIPVYRQQDDPSLLVKNKETFQKCYEHLGNGGAILIFPEGISRTGRKLQPLKTGTARIALGAMEHFNFNIDIKIICAGLNYEDPHKFRRDVYVAFSEPTHVPDYNKQFQTEGFAAAEALTAEIRKRLEQAIIHTEDAETDQLTLEIEKLYRYKLMKARGMEGGPAEKFEMTKGIVRAINYFQEHDTARVKRIGAETRNYFETVEALGLSDRIVRGGQGKRWLKNTGELLLIIFGFPFFFWGLIHNYLPFATASFISRKFVKQSEFRGGVGAAAGMFLFLIWYTALAILSWENFHAWEFTSRPGWIWLIYFFTWPVTGLFTWFYYRSLSIIRSRWLFMSLFFRESTMVADLVMRRKKLIEEFDKAVAEMSEATAEKNPSL
ncbi:MAG TPA: lysophospholipid acyltransferase family protein [Bacteroidia bacterium]|nr:lysophospholipid acyltransferase family protein [Bacteroidia bacterium]